VNEKRRKAYVQNLYSIALNLSCTWKMDKNKEEKKWFWKC